MWVCEYVNNLIQFYANLIKTDMQTVDMVQAHLHMRVCGYTCMRACLCKWAYVRTMEWNGYVNFRKKRNQHMCIWAPFKNQLMHWKPRFIIPKHNRKRNENKAHLHKLRHKNFVHICGHWPSSRFFVFRTSFLFFLCHVHGLVHIVCQQMNERVS